MNEDATLRLLKQRSGGVGGVRIAIAEAYGWTGCYVTDRYATGIDPNGIERDLPNYPLDRDAMQNAVATLGGLEKDLFASLLVELVDPSRIDGFGDPENGSPQLSWPGVFSVATASAAHHAEAFLRVIEWRRRK